MSQWSRLAHLLLLFIAVVVKGYWVKRIPITKSLLTAAASRLIASFHSAFCLHVIAMLTLMPIIFTSTLGLRIIFSRLVRVHGLSSLLLCNLI